MKRFTTPLTLDARMPAGMLWKSRIPALHDSVAAILMFGIGFSPITALALSLMGILTLHISPQGEDMMFVITPTSLLLSWIGHLVFGYTLGCLVNRFGPVWIQIPEQGRLFIDGRGSGR